MAIVNYLYKYAANYARRAYFCAGKAWAIFFVLNVTLEASFFERALLWSSTPSKMDIPEHGFSWHGDQGGDISFLHRIFAGQFVVEMSTLSIPLQSIYAQSNYCQYRRASVYILVSLEALPPAIFWTRREASSCLSSSSCFVKSAFDRARSSLGLLVLLDYTN